MFVGGVESISLMLMAPFKHSRMGGRTTFCEDFVNVAGGLSAPAEPGVVATMVQSVLRRRRVVSKDSPTKLTYEDYLQFPDDGLRHEIIEGEHYVNPSPSTRHQRILLNVSHLIQSYLDTHPIGEIFFTPFDVRAFRVCVSSNGLDLRPIFVSAPTERSSHRRCL